jgi:hypothetical protein
VFPLGMLGHRQVCWILLTFQICCVFAVLITQKLAFQNSHFILCIKCSASTSSPVLSLLEYAQGFEVSNHSASAWMLVFTGFVFYWLLIVVACANLLLWRSLCNSICDMHKMRHLSWNQKKKANSFFIKFDVSIDCAITCCYVEMYGCLACNR